MSTIVCLTCGNTAESQRSTKLYCSRKCWPGKLPHTEEQKLLARIRNQRYWAGLSPERKLVKIRKDNEREKEKGWPTAQRFRDSHPDVISATNAFRSALHRGSRGSKVMVAGLLERHGEWCGLCGLPLGGDITVDHLRPVARGGTHESHNLVLAHKSCNSSKNNKPFIQWALSFTP